MKKGLFVLCMVLVASSLLAQSMIRHGRVTDQIEPGAVPVGVLTPVGVNVVVRDANDRLVGPVDGTQGNIPNIVLQFGADLLQIPVLPDRLQGNRDDLLYVLPDCQGTPYIQFPRGNALFRDVSIGSPNSTAYVRNPSAFVTQGPKVSVAFLGGCQNSNGAVGPIVEAMPLVELGNFFTPPFHLEVDDGGSDHVHDYLTGRGIGHNNMVTETGPAK